MIIGLAGGIASGKSTAAEVFKRLGLKVIDADAVYRKLSKEGTALNSLLKKEFRDCVIDNKLNKTMMYNRVFNNSADRELLNFITHPFITKKIKSMINLGEITVVEAALLFESGFYKSCDVIVCVVAPYQQRLKRLLERSKHDTITAKKIIDSQLSDDELIKRCDYVIHNDGDVALLEERVKELYQRLEKSI